MESPMQTQLLPLTAQCKRPTLSPAGTPTQWKSTKRQCIERNLLSLTPTTTKELDVSAHTNQPLPQTTRCVKDLSVKEYSCTPTEKEAVRELKKLWFHYNLSTHAVRKILNYFSTFSSTF